MNDSINLLRHHSRKLIRELGMLQLNKIDAKEQPSYWHALIEINKEPDVTSAKLSQLLLISLPTLSRIVASLINDGLITVTEGIDKRERFLRITEKGKEKIQYIDEYSNTKIKRAFHFLTQEDKEQVISAIGKYALALEQSRIVRDQVKILRLSTSRTLRKQIIHMIERIQVDEFNISITPEINASVLKAEEEYYFHNSCNFWYAVDAQGAIIGSIGLKKLNDTQGELKKFFLTPEYRGLGIASLLLRTLIKNALKHGFKELFLGTVDQLQAAQRFYEKNGFKPIKKELLPSQFVLCPVDTLFYQGETKKIAHLLDELA
ncbi:bifunctional helix-turn-helix transcriptional regulator/GNAT family N-acetyltransferase [Legionella bononiensis]|uniref:Bifunctional helix-turn-helix transcriptional regulator/GNAT family N-acetyltransferase n=1 Tax=Legionella bononiensis TaxID=2793102 RepID=A0ABS1WC27_9GAMM|nr:bifunctional helix-turn-helix transcriptional regulator/GNAT family N-acetyltransferase [Legionella bononiensis]MBL7481106.1 bifunctional helix-turn-helix transcriptional regulator/GNAT family N-acetyltransferase [Legionella bononiensis]MBL7526815.1 bifunctional helix-turn-helix transcriptional regulator/GNAT family N-acetyltransferase [Legionella bononiensis]MBL7564222.1 bifunctional helix-turn-helix transcriptional regulator/GNAT family N-acetyltransferase [Legionella bononiensis]